MRISIFSRRARASASDPSAATSLRNVLALSSKAARAARPVETFGGDGQLGVQLLRHGERGRNAAIDIAGAFERIRQQDHETSIGRVGPVERSRNVNSGVRVREPSFISPRVTARSLPCNSARALISPKVCSPAAAPVFLSREVDRFIDGGADGGVAAAQILHAREGEQAEAQHSLRLVVGRGHENLPRSRDAALREIQGAAEVAERRIIDRELALHQHPASGEIEIAGRRRSQTLDDGLRRAQDAPHRGGRHAFDPAKALRDFDDEAIGRLAGDLEAVLSARGLAPRDDAERDADVAITAKMAAATPTTRTSWREWRASSVARSVSA